MRINDIVNTVAAYQVIAQRQAQLAQGRVQVLASAGRDLGLDLTSQAQIGAALDGRPGPLTDESDLGGSDGLELSPSARAASEEVTLEGEDDSLAAIVERFVRQRSVLNVAFPIATPGGAGLFSLSVELDQAYRVVEFVPRSEWTA